MTIHCLHIQHESVLPDPLQTRADLPPLDNGLSQPLSQNTELLPAIPPPREFSGLPTRHSTFAVSISLARRPAPLPPVAATRRRTVGSRPFHQARVSDATSGKSSRPPLILVNQHSVQETEEVAYCNILSQSQSPGTTQSLLGYREREADSSPPSSPQYEVLVHPLSVSGQTQPSAMPNLTPDTINASYDQGDSPIASSQVQICHKSTDTT